MRVLITGASGFIGARLCAACVARGDQVRVLRRAGSSLRGLGDLPVEHLVGDLLDRGLVERAAEGCDLVFHVAAIAAYWRARPEQIYQVNVEGTRAVMEACLRAGVARVVHTSSVAAVGVAADGPADEATPFDALSAGFVYADSKHRAEGVVADAVARGLQAVVVNPAVVIGAGDHYVNSGRMVVEYGRGRIPVVPPGGMCVADVDAVVAGHLAAAARGRVGERYILGGENRTYLEVASTIADVAGVRRPWLVVPEALLGVVAAGAALVSRLSPKPLPINAEQIRLSRVPFYFDSGKAVRELGYPIMPLRGAVEKALRWYRANGYV